MGKTKKVFVICGRREEIDAQQLIADVGAKQKQALK